jgi:hypothetical protein
VLRSPSRAANGEVWALFVTAMFPPRIGPLVADHTRQSSSGASSRDSET